LSKRDHRELALNRSGFSQSLIDSVFTATTVFPDCLRLKSIVESPLNQQIEEGKREILSVFFHLAYFSLDWHKVMIFALNMIIMLPTIGLSL